MVQRDEDLLSVTPTPSARRILWVAEENAIRVVQNRPTWCGAGRPSSSRRAAALRPYQRQRHPAAKTNHSTVLLRSQKLGSQQVGTVPP
jgi:hypothetical protein